MLQQREKSYCVCFFLGEIVHQKEREFYFIIFFPFSVGFLVPSLSASSELFECNLQFGCELKRNNKKFVSLITHIN